MEHYSTFVGVFVLIILVIILICRNIVNFKPSPGDKILIYAPAPVISEGAFGMGLIYTLQAVEILEKEGIPPENVKFDVHGRFYGQMVPRMMNPKVVANFDKFDKRLMLNQITSSQLFKPIDATRNVEEYFKFYNYIFNKWFKIPNEVMPKVPAFNRDTTLGLHYRGTDKIHDRLENTAITAEEFITIIKDFLQKNSYIDTIFIATDDANFIPKLHTTFPQMSIIQYEQTRSKNNKSLHKYTAIDGNDKIINPWIDVVALSRCRYVLKISSALSAWAKILNPSLEIYQVNATRQGWYPTAGIPPYRSNTPAIKRILDRTLRGNYYKG